MTHRGVYNFTLTFSPTPASDLESQLSWSQSKEPKSMDPKPNKAMDPEFRKPKTIEPRS